MGREEDGRPNNLKLTSGAENFWLVSFVSIGLARFLDHWFFFVGGGRK